MKADVVVLAMLAALTTDPAAAIERIQTGGKSCAEIQSLVQAKRAVILQYPSTQRSGLLLYQRVVANSDVCLGNGYGERSYVPTRDNNNCPIWICASSTDLRP